jgi:hypothetical protein
MAKYAIQYKNNSKTFNHIIEAKSAVEIKNIFQDLINAELTEINEIVYENPTYPKDDSNYVKSVTCLLRDKHRKPYSFKVPKLKKTITTSELKNHINSYIKINSQTPYSIELTQYF